jgi:hypothetical protein
MIVGGPRFWKDIPRWDVDLAIFSNSNIPNQNLDWSDVLVQKQPKLGQWQQHTWTTPRRTKDEEHQKDENANNKQQMTSNSAKVSKRHIKNTRGGRLDMKIFFFSNRGH